MGKSGRALRKDFSRRFALDSRQQIQEYHCVEHLHVNPDGTELEKEIELEIAHVLFLDIGTLLQALG